MKGPSRQAVLGIDGGAFFHGSRKVFSGISFLLDGAKTALVGENGVGKSTLLKCLSGELELNGGKIVKSRDLKVGYLAQEVPEGLAGGSTSCWTKSVSRRRWPRVGSGRCRAVGSAWC